MTENTIEVGFRRLLSNAPAAIIWLSIFGAFFYWVDFSVPALTKINTL